MLNEKFNMLKVISRSNRKDNKNAYWKCQCDCGNIVEMTTSNIKNPNNKSCGCYRKRLFNPNHPSWKGYKELPLSIITGIKARAKRKKLKYNITIKYIYNLLEQQKYRCALSGRQLIFGGYGFNKSKYNHNLSLDRIDSTKGYIKGNVQWVHKDINFMKQQFNEKYFIDTCKEIVNYRG